MKYKKGNLLNQNVVDKHLNPIHLILFILILISCEKTQEIKLE